MIPDEAVEAAALATYGSESAALWADEEPKVKSYYLTAARAALEAALPHLASAAKQPQRTSPTDWPDVPRRQ